MYIITTTITSCIKSKKVNRKCLCLPITIQGKILNNIGVDAHTLTSAEKVMPIASRVART